MEGMTGYVMPLEPPAVGWDIHCHTAFSDGTETPATLAEQSKALGLKGVAISLTIGMAVYFLFIRLVLMDRKGAEAVYLERWPRWLSLEERVYRPVIRGLYRVLNVVMRAVCDALDFLVLVARRTFLRDSRPRRHKSPRSAMIHAMTHGGQRTEQEAADRLGTILDTLRRMEGSLSYALLMACLGLCIVLVCILLYVF